MTYLLLLRGINGGTYHQVKMAALRDWLTAAGFTQVVSYANSGNFILDGPDNQAVCTQRVADVLATNVDFPLNFGLFPATTLCREFQQAPAWWDGTGQRQHLCLFKLTNYREQVTWLRDRLTTLDHIVTTPHLIFWTVDAVGNFQHSAYGQVFGTPFYQQTSARSYRTTRKLAQLLQERLDHPCYNREDDL